MVQNFGRNGFERQSFARRRALDDVHYVLYEGSMRSASRRIAGHSSSPICRRVPGL